jgi:hypothetical protein
MTGAGASDGPGRARCHRDGLPAGTSEGMPAGLPDGLLAEYAAGSLPDADRARVAAHLAGCAPCRADHAAWRAIAAAGPDPGPPPDPARLVRAALTRSALDEPAPGLGTSWPTRRIRYLASVVLAEARLIRLAVPVASALVMALGVLLVLVDGMADAAPDPVAAGDLLALVAPIVAAAGVAGVHRSSRDPAAELLAAVPASGRLLLLVRLALVFGYDLVLALGASAVLAAVTTDTTGVTVAAGMNALIATWLGPMALLSALSLLVAVRFGPDVALGTAVGVWALRLLAESGFASDGPPVRLILAAWSTNATVLALSAALAILAVVVAGPRGSFPGEPSGGLRATYPV